jgi:alkanesulfonate monooxygenase SsuD/methylene tetrahydromethanopterin reductase-like flavin-dependent oxidoreductase (luciferase family)
MVAGASTVGEMRGFGIDASVPVEVAAEVASQVESAGYNSFWVNGSPHQGALDILDVAAQRTSLDLGVGVFPLPKISADELVAEVTKRRLPQDRLWLGIGSGRRPGALAEVRSAVQTMRAQLDVTVTTGAVGPKMTALAGEVSDAVIFTWSIAAEVEQNRIILDKAAEAIHRKVPTVVSFIRCGLLPQAAKAVAERADVYGAIPHYQAVFGRYGLKASDTIVTGGSREELAPGIAAEEQALDISIIRAIPADNTLESLSELVMACAP